MKENPLARLPKLPEFGRNKAFYYSALLHAALILFFVVGIDWQTATPIQPAGTPQVMNATAVDSSKIGQKLKKLKAPEPEKIETVKKEEEETLQRVQKEEEKLRELRKQEEVAREQELEQKREETKQVEQQKKAEEQKKLEAKKRADADKKKKAEAEKKAQAEAEKKKKAEAEKKAKAEAEKKKKAEAEKKAKAEAEKKAKAEAEKKRKAAELAAALAAEEAEAAAAAQGVADGNEIQRYLGRIQAAVSGRFVYPAGLPPGLKCTLFVRLIPGGEVVEARVVQSSGNAVFDRQAENAVRGAAPLPVPPEARLFNQMREFSFVFEP